MSTCLSGLLVHFVIWVVDCTEYHMDCRYFYLK